MSAPKKKLKKSAKLIIGALVGVVLIGCGIGIYLMAGKSGGGINSNLITVTNEQSEPLANGTRSVNMSISSRSEEAVYVRVKLEADPDMMLSSDGKIYKHPTGYYEAVPDGWIQWFSDDENISGYFYYTQPLHYLAQTNSVVSFYKSVDPDSKGKLKMTADCIPVGEAKNYKEAWESYFAAK